MSIKKDNVASVTCEGNTCTSSDGWSRTDNGDGTYTVTGLSGDLADYNGTWTTVDAGTEGAISSTDIENYFGWSDGTLEDGYYIKQ